MLDIHTGLGTLPETVLAVKPETDTAVRTRILIYVSKCLRQIMRRCNKDNNKCCK